MEKMNNSFNRILTGMIENDMIINKIFHKLTERISFHVEIAKQY